MQGGLAPLLSDARQGEHRDPYGDDAKPRKPPTLVLAIDQAEELFLADGAEEADAFLDLLARRLLPRTTPALIVLFTIRSDSYELLQTAKSLEGMRQHTFSLPPMPKGAYADVIKGPARAARRHERALKIEEPLVDALLSDIEAGGAKDALPLLAFTLERLYREYGGDGDLKLAEYEELGRVKGSIEAAVERAPEGGRCRPEDPARPAGPSRPPAPRSHSRGLPASIPTPGSPRRRVARLSEIPEEAAVR